ncbi:dATP/dGTP diphosphohydrolase domain-containing protein [Brucella anthropi]|uniref:dATP/dGTP diphosphohydrolase domain-containing protein n=1 Tax=Brucella anthropi TaxID=529 RepID=UPI001CFF4237|nr:dATP/dGTP diphosphohydrolase domain-containing protein [Brucella anthropi]
MHKTVIDPNPLESLTSQRVNELNTPLSSKGRTDDAAESSTAQFRRIPDSNPKSAIGLTKPSTFSIPPVAELHLGAAMANGATKYGTFNWREHAVSVSVYVDAIRRHLAAFRDGEDIASDSGVHHLAHVMACCAIVLDAMECGKLIDDRGHQGPASKVIHTMTKPC